MQEATLNSRIPWLVALGLAPASVLAVLDAGVLGLRCVRAPLYLYLTALAGGVVLASFVVPPRSISGRPRFWLGAAVAALVAFGIGGAVLVAVSPTPWESHCAWRYCDRLPGPGLSRSPFPVSTTCSALDLCANEFPYSTTGSAELQRKLDELHCPPP